MQLSYYPIRGLAHQIRNLAHFLGFEFKETRYTNVDDWFKNDKKATNMLFPNLPLLVDGDFKLSESKAIMLYLCIKAKKEEMLGKTNKDQMIMEQILGVVTDCDLAVGILSYQTDEIAQFEQALNNKVLPKLEDLNKFLDNRQYIAGDYLTYAEFMINERLMMINAFAQKVLKINIFEKFANIKKYNENFMNLPKVKEFFEKKEFDLPFSSPYAKFKV